MSSDEKDIAESLHVLLSTRPGERIMVPGYGCSLESLLFESINLTLTTQITELIRTAILYYEPRIDLENVTLNPDYVLDGRIDIILDYRIRPPIRDRTWFTHSTDSKETTFHTLKQAHYE